MLKKTQQKTIKQRVVSRVKGQVIQSQIIFRNFFISKNQPNENGEIANLPSTITTKDPFFLAFFFRIISVGEKELNTFMPEGKQIKKRKI